MKNLQKSSPSYDTTTLCWKFHMEYSCSPLSGLIILRRYFSLQCQLRLWFSVYFIVVHYNPYGLGSKGSSRKRIVCGGVNSQPPPRPRGHWKLLGRTRTLERQGDMVTLPFLLGRGSRYIHRITSSPETFS
jgi:hypothetical protein